MSKSDSVKADKPVAVKWSGFGVCLSKHLPFGTDSLFGTFFLLDTFVTLFLCLSHRSLWISEKFSKLGQWTQRLWPLYLLSSIHIKLHKHCLSKICITIKDKIQTSQDQNRFKVQDQFPHCVRLLLNKFTTDADIQLRESLDGFGLLFSKENLMHYCAVAHWWGGTRFSKIIQKSLETNQTHVCLIDSKFGAIHIAFCMNVCRCWQ